MTRVDLSVRVGPFWHPYTNPNEEQKPTSFMAIMLFKIPIFKNNYK